MNGMNAMERALVQLPGGTDGMGGPRLLEKEFWEGFGNLCLALAASLLREAQGVGWPWMCPSWIFHIPGRLFWGCLEFPQLPSGRVPGGQMLSRNGEYSCLSPQKG